MSTFSMLVHMSTVPSQLSLRHLWSQMINYAVWWRLTREIHPTVVSVLLLKKSWFIIFILSHFITPSFFCPFTSYFCFYAVNLKQMDWTLKSLVFCNVFIILNSDFRKWFPKFGALSVVHLFPHCRAVPSLRSDKSWHFTCFLHVMSSPGVATVTEQDSKGKEKGWEERGGVLLLWRQCICISKALQHVVSIWKVSEFTQGDHWRK